MTEAKTTAVDDAQKLTAEQILHHDRCRSKSGYDCTCSPERQGWRAALSKVADLEAQLTAMTEDRDLWKDAHDDDCPNRNMLETVEAQLQATIEQLKKARESQP